VLIQNYEKKMIWQKNNDATTYKQQGNMTTLLIDNNDSFTYNVLELLRQSNTDKVNIVRSGKLSDHDIKAADNIIISPGPSLPKDFPAIGYLLENFATSKPILGICLGHQAICEFFGASLYNLPTVCHGQAHIINVDKSAKLYANMPESFKVGLYHSWAVSKKNLPENIMITAESENGIIMSMQHKTLDIHGIQYHPESFLSENGLQIINNFLK
jgi:anthranilate synthase/aminodeoxychorismate synthase-like glutamine amidotransferase